MTVTDDGRGIPVDIMKKENKPAAEVVLTVLHAGGKFGDGGGYKVSGGLHGVGVSVVNALSEELELTIWRDGFEWTQTLRARQAAGPSSRRARRPTAAARRITFLPDLEIFETIEYDDTVLTQRFRETAFLTAGLKIDFTDERGEGEKHIVPVRRRHRRLRPLPARRRARARRSARRSPTSRTRPTSARSRSRCSGTTATRSRCSRSPTTSTRTRAARTSPVSARR